MFSPSSSQADTLRLEVKPLTIHVVEKQGEAHALFGRAHRTTAGQ